jgi:predicted transposase YbfD/YdcC
MAGIEKWQDIQSVVEVTRKRTFKKKGKEQIDEEVSYYISSLGDDVKEAARVIRNHWAIENSQHWILDVTFREDESQIYAEDGAKNMALFRRALLNLIKAHPLKDSVAGKMMRRVGIANSGRKYYLVKKRAKYNPALSLIPNTVIKG